MTYSTSRKDKLVLLREFCNLETGQLYESAFDYENDLFEKGCRRRGYYDGPRQPKRKARLMQKVRRDIERCDKCPGMNIKRYTEAAPGWGYLNADIFFVGQSLHMPGVQSGLPFILASGFFMDAALRLSGLLRNQIYISNVVHCHPPRNRPSTEEEKTNCVSYLQRELDIVKPKAVFLLGNDAKQADLHLPDEAIERCFKHPAALLRGAPPENAVNYIVKMSFEIDKTLNHLTQNRNGFL